MKQGINEIIENKELIVDLPVIDRGESWINVEWNNTCVYIGQGRFSDLIALQSDDMNKPMYRGGFTDLYARKGQKLSEILELRM